MSVSNVAKGLLTNAFRGVPFSFSNTWYLAAFLSQPDADGLTTGHELAGNGYARVPITLDDYGTYVAISSVVQFPASTGAWSTITHWGLCTAQTGGVVHIWTNGTLNVSAANQVVTINNLSVVFT